MQGMTFVEDQHKRSKYTTLKDRGAGRTQTQRNDSGRSQVLHLILKVGNKDVAQYLFEINPALARHLQRASIYTSFNSLPHWPLNMRSQ
jgi:hypothetical protein